MKPIKLFSLLALASALVIVTGCPSTQPKTTVLPGPGGPGNGNDLGAGQKIGSGDTLLTDANGNHASVDQSKYSNYSADAATLKPQTIYFDLDKSTIKPSEQSKIDEVAAYLKSNSGKVLRVEGNCDERGTEEYNRSLGERRASVAREYLIQSGIDPARVITLTNGEDKPAVTGHSEEAWAKNRRDEFVVLSPP